MYSRSVRSYDSEFLGVISVSYSLFGNLPADSWCIPVSYLVMVQCYDGEFSYLIGYSQSLSSHMTASSLLIDFPDVLPAIVRAHDGGLFQSVIWSLFSVMIAILMVNWLPGSTPGYSITVRYT